MTKSEDTDIRQSETVARCLSDGRVDHNCRYSISDTLPSWWKGPDRELPPLQFSISDGSKFVVVSLRGISSTEELRARLNEFDLEDAYSRATASGPGVLDLKEGVR